MRIVILAALAVAAGPAQADGPDPGGLDDRRNGWYATLSGGASIQFDQNSTALGSLAAGAPTGAAIDTDFQTGFAVGGRVGYAFQPFSGPLGTTRFRLALDHAYRQNSFSASTLGAVSGDNSSNSFMALGIIEWPGAWFGLSPYLGAGIGIAGIESDQFADLDGDGVADVEFGGPVEAELAYQGLGGLSYPLGEAIDIFGEVRFSATLSPEFELIDLASDTTLGNFDSEYRLIHAVVGIRYSF